MSNTASNHPLPALNGLVLSGGQSSRMGEDKGALIYHGKSQREHVYDLLLPYCASVFVSCNAEQTDSIVDLPKIEDTFADSGPLAGIVSAFPQQPESAWLCVACDLPFLDKVTLDYLISHRDPSKTATAFWNAAADFPEPLLAIWEPAAFPLLLNHFNKGYKSPGKLLLGMNAQLLKAPDASVFRNVNTIEDYREALALIRSKGSK